MINLSHKVALKRFLKRDPPPLLITLKRSIETHTNSFGKNDSIHDSVETTLPTSTSKSSSSNGSGLLILSPTLWPEPNSSAAGVRTTALLNHFSCIKQQNIFSEAHYGSGKGRPTHSIKDKNTLINKQVSLHHVPTNRTPAIEAFLTSKTMEKLTTVIFDRYFAEEAYSFHFHRLRPNVLRILDMQDMHSLRLHRKHVFENWERNDDDSNEKGRNLIQSIIQSIPRLDNDSNSLLLRELASIHRSDLVLVCSPFEMNLLQNEYGISKDKLVLAPFFTKEAEQHSEIKSNFQDRCDFVSLGGFRHPPNVDQVLFLKHDIWPKIRKRLPNATIHIYGSYVPQQIQELHQPSSGFIIKGFMDELKNLSSYRVMLSPLRYGAGIKGKIVDAWRFRLPVVTTPIGSEGMHPHYGETQTIFFNDTSPVDDWWGGLVADTVDTFVDSAVKLYTDEVLWMQTQKNIRSLLIKLYGSKSNLDKLDDAIRIALRERTQRRQRDYTSGMLWHHTMRSSEYFSRWIELKESQSMPPV